MEILFCDISPDSLLVREDGSLSLVDSGNGGPLNSVENKLQNKLIAVNPGYSPIEQYKSNGIMGPWTDEYAVAATIYYCVTGTEPSEASERAKEKDFARAMLNNRCPKLSAQVKNVIMKGMGIYKEERFPDMKAFEEALYQALPSPPPSRKSLTKTDWWIVGAIFLGFIIVCIACCGLKNTIVILLCNIAKILGCYFGCFIVWMAKKVFSLFS